MIYASAVLLNFLNFLIQEDIKNFHPVITLDSFEHLHCVTWSEQGGHTGVYKVGKLGIECNRTGKWRMGAERVNWAVLGLECIDQNRPIKI